MQIVTQERTNARKCSPGPPFRCPYPLRVHRGVVPAALVVVAVTAAAAAALPAPGGAGTGEPTAVGAPVLTLRRTPALLARPLGHARLRQALHRFLASDPGPSCLLVTSADGVVFEHHADRPLSAASGMKLLTAAAALHAIGERGSVPYPDGGDAAAGDIVAHMLRESDNAAAEALLRAVGRQAAGEATVEAGRRAVPDVLTAARLPVAGVRVVDGSGLDRANRATCRILHAVVDRASDDGPIGRGLPVAGESGTLATRFTELSGLVRAKTGWIRDVATLAGLIYTPGGRLAFAYISNGAVTPSAGASLQDELVAALAELPAVVGYEVLGPAGHPAAPDPP